MKRQVVTVELIGLDDDSTVAGSTYSWNGGIRRSEEMARELARAIGERLDGGDPRRYTVGQWDTYERTWTAENTGRRYIARVQRTL